MYVLQDEGAEGGEASGTPKQRSGPTASELEDQLAEQEKMIMQLKDMIRENEDALRKKDKDLKELNASFSKHKLQSKAKLTSMNKELQEAQRVASDVLERVSPDLIIIAL